MKLMAMKHDVIVAETLDDIRLLAGAVGLTSGGDGIRFDKVITLHDQESGDIELLHYGEEALMVSDTADTQSWSVVEIEEIALDFEVLEERDAKGFLG